MRPYLIMLAVAFLPSCGKKPLTSQDELVSEWTKDGKTMVIMRKGVQIATFRNSSNACFVELSGPNGPAGASVSYYEEDSAGGALESKNIALVWSQKDGTFKTISYDSEGNIVKRSQDPKTK